MREIKRGGKTLHVFLFCLFGLQHLLQAMLTSMAALCLVQTIVWKYVRDVNKARIILTWERTHKEGLKKQELNDLDILIQEKGCVNMRWK